eukprot:2406758-Pleurochrysis_carterae.AAC.1
MRRSADFQDQTTNTCHLSQASEAGAWNSHSQRHFKDRNCAKLGREADVLVAKALKKQKR